MRKPLKIALSVVVGLVVLAGAGAGFLFHRMQVKNAGPPPPACAAPSIARGAFEAPVALSDARSPGDYQIEPAAALLPDGTLAVAYNGRGGLFSPSAIGLAAVAPDGKLRAGSLPTSRSQHFDIWMDRDAAGRLHLVWLGHDGGLPDKHVEVGYATSTDGIAWSPPRPIHDAPHDCPGDMRGCMDKPMIAIGRDAAREGGEAIAAFYFSEAGEGLRMVRSTDGGARFGESVPVGGQGAYADVVVSLRGRVHLVSTVWDVPDADRFGDARIRVEYVRADDGQKFGAPVRVSREGDVVPFFFSNPQVVADEARGLLYVLYPAGPSQRWDLWLATSRDDGKTWSHARVNDDSPCATHMTPQAALDPKTGTVHVTWLENRSGMGAIAYAACESGGARCGANERVGDRPFASFRLARHAPDWVGEYGVLLVDEGRRALHAVWTQPVDDDGGRGRSRIFWARRKLD